MIFYNSISIEIYRRHASDRKKGDRSRFLLIFDFLLFFFGFVIGAAGNATSADGRSSSRRCRDGTGATVETIASAQATATTPTTVGQWRRRTCHGHANWTSRSVGRRPATTAATAPTFHAKSAAANPRRFRHSDSSLASPSARRTCYRTQFHSSRPAAPNPAAATTDWATRTEFHGRRSQSSRAGCAGGSDRGRSVAAATARSPPAAANTTAAATTQATAAFHQDGKHQEGGRNGRICPDGQSATTVCHATTAAKAPIPVPASSFCSWAQCGRFRSGDAHADARSSSHASAAGPATTTHAATNATTTAEAASVPARRG